MAPGENPSSALPAPAPRYDRLAMALHWIVAALLLVAVIYGLRAVSADDAHVDRLMGMHKSFGLTLLGLVVLRILWRIGHRPPPLPRTLPPLSRKGANAAHLLIYAVILLLPLTGYIHDSAWKLAASHPIVLYGTVPFPRIGAVQALPADLKEAVHSVFGAAHVWLGYALYLLFALHVAAVLKHHAMDGVPVLRRMLPGPRRAHP